MSSLLAAAVAAALAILVAVAGLAYLGPVVGGAAARGVASQLLASAGQIVAAESLYEADSAGVALVDEAPGTAVTGLVAAGYLGALLAAPSDVADPAAPWLVGTQGAAIAGAPPYVALALDPGRDATDRVCAILADQSNPLFGCVSNLDTMAPPEPAGRQGRRVFFYFQKVEGR